MPEPTVTVRMKEDGKRAARRVRACACFLPCGVFRSLHAGNDMPYFTVLFDHVLPQEVR